MTWRVTTNHENATLSSGSWQVLKVLGDGGSGEGSSFKKGLPPKMHFHRNRPENRG